MKKSFIVILGLVGVLLSSSTVRADGKELQVVANYYQAVPSYTVRSTDQYAVVPYMVAVSPAPAIDFRQCMAERSDLQGQVSELQEAVQDLEAKVERICEERCARSRRHDTCLSDCLN